MPRNHRKVIVRDRLKLVKIAFEIALFGLPVAWAGQPPAPCASNQLEALARRLETQAENELWRRAAESEQRALHHEFSVTHREEIEKARKHGILSPRREALLAELDIHLGDGTGAGVSVPMPHVLEAQWEARQASRGIPPDKRIKLVRVYKAPDGRILALGLSEAPCQGCVITQDLVPHEIAAKLWSERKMIIGSADRQVVEGGSQWAHDVMGHLPGILEHPEYADALVESGRQVVLAYEKLHRLEASGAPTEAIREQWLQANQMKDRMIYAAENAVVVRPAADLSAHLSLPPGALQNPDYNRILNHLDSDSPAEIDAAYQAIRKHYSEWVDLAGGTAGDFSQAVKRTEGTASFVMIDGLEKAYMELITVFNRTRSPGARIRALAKIETLLIKSQKVRPEDFARAVAHDVDKGSPLASLLCDEHLILPGTTGFCQ